MAFWGNQKRNSIAPRWLPPCTLPTSPEYGNVLKEAGCLKGICLCLFLVSLAHFEQPPSLPLPAPALS